MNIKNTNQSAQAIDDINAELLNYIKQPVVDRFKQIYPTTEDAEIDTLASTFCDLIVNPPEHDENPDIVLVKRDGVVEEEYKRYTDYDTVLYDLHDKLGLSDEEGNNNFDSLDELSSSAAEALMEYCQKQGLMHLNELFDGDNSSDGGEIVAFGFGFVDGNNEMQEFTSSQPIQKKIIH